MSNESDDEDSKFINSKIELIAIVLMIAFAFVIGILTLISLTEIL